MQTQLWLELGTHDNEPLPLDSCPVGLSLLAQPGRLARTLLERLPSAAGPSKSCALSQRMVDSTVIGLGLCASKEHSTLPHSVFESPVFESLIRCSSALLDIRVPHSVFEFLGFPSRTSSFQGPGVVP